MPQLRSRHLLAGGGDMRPMRFQMATAESGERLGWAEMSVLRDFFSASSELWPYLRSDVSVVSDFTRVSNSRFGDDGGCNSSRIE